MRYCLLSYYLLLYCLTTLGDSMGEFFMESLREVLLLLGLVLCPELLKLREPLPNPEELRMDCLRPN
jgi:hypothetical protein